MKQQTVPRATLGRLPEYLQYLKSLDKEVENVSSTTIAKALELGDVQVRKGPERRLQYRQTENRLLRSGAYRLP